MCGAIAADDRLHRDWPEVTPDAMPWLRGQPAVHRGQGVRPLWREWARPFHLSVIAQTAAGGGFNVRSTLCASSARIAKDAAHR
jgi:hypothetical protein